MMQPNGEEAEIPFKTLHTCVRDTAELFTVVQKQMSATAINDRELF